MIIVYIWTIWDLFVKLYRLPEVPPDTAETNSVMRLHEPPNFKHITPDAIITGCAKLSIEYDVDLGKHIQKLKGTGCMY